MLAKARKRPMSPKRTLLFRDFITAVEQTICSSIESDPNYSPDWPVHEVIDGIDWLDLGFYLPDKLGFEFNDDQKKVFHEMAGHPGFQRPITTNITWFHMYQFFAKCKANKDDPFQVDLLRTIGQYLRPQSGLERISPGNKWLKHGLSQFADRWNFDLPEDILRKSAYRNCSIRQLIDRIENAYTGH